MGGWEGAEAGMTRGLGGRILASLRTSLVPQWLGTLAVTFSPKVLQHSSDCRLAWTSRGQMAATVTIDKVYFETLLRRWVEWYPDYIVNRWLINMW